VAFWIKMLFNVRKRPDHQKTWFWPLLVVGVICSFVFWPGLLVLSGVYWYKAGRIPPVSNGEDLGPNPFS
tara:strand:- start:576 stop:785 length:210 start_codon:yes stop_codon:yes gene_type:complete